MYFSDTQNGVRVPETRQYIISSKISNHHAQKKVRVRMKQMKEKKVLMKMKKTGMETLWLKTLRLLLPLLRHRGELDQPAHMHELRPASGPLHPVAP